MVIEIMALMHIGLEANFSYTKKSKDDDGDSCGVNSGPGGSSAQMKTMATSPCAQSAQRQ